MGLNCYATSATAISICSCTRAVLLGNGCGVLLFHKKEIAFWELEPQHQNHRAPNQ
ncbi:predicted protein [Pyrenophora tritici-repentis Pt-1C-BFP]|uniref:Uncharacterized protein n=1 Tax=Pyrenophora tritici-repentis (strain Pt-1C-BFP) TaxID=426418 RepID=B2VT58_PYRTR|nr:uncharacterized protein PTRG_01894 [Pyrenophora tritici-repentis Pt-1C-BFP]EDU41332.1 predicted protein [Pyrenophora tritici-repentis Pt-1C-BFP]